MSKTTGDRGEDIAAAYLEAQGYVILDRNYRFERAEVDLVCYQPDAIAERGGELVFVEVKARTGTGFGRPEEAVTEEKKRHILRATEAYLYERQLTGSPCRFDVLGILLRPGREPEIEHYKNAFWFF